MSFTLAAFASRFNTIQPTQAQLKALEARCRQLLEQDGHLPCQVQSDKEYRTLVLPYALDRPSEGGAEALLGGMMGGMDDAFLLADDPVGSPALSNSRGPRRGGGTGGGGVGGTRYPKTFPFSTVVPKLSLELHRVVVLCLLFGLQLQLPAMEATLLQVGGGLSKEGPRTRSDQCVCVHTPCHPHTRAHTYTHTFTGGGRQPHDAEPAAEQGAGGRGWGGGGGQLPHQQGRADLGRRRHARADDHGCVGVSV